MWRDTGTNRQRSTNWRALEVYCGSGQRLSFDGDVDPGVAIGFYPRRPSNPKPGVDLWWSAAAMPETIDEVIDLIDSQGLPVETIVIGGLRRYPVFDDVWPRWLARWSRCEGVKSLVVDTSQLSDGQRRRLIEATRRRLVLSADENPVADAVKAVKRWLIEGLTGR